MKIKKLSKKQTEIFKVLMEKAEKAEDKAIKLDAEGGFMPLNVEILYRTQVNGETTPVLALAHYFEQNGDLVPDPDMEVMYIPSKNSVLPISYQNQIAYTRALFFDPEAKKWKGHPEKINDLVGFLGMWLENIAQQQELYVKS